jgi:hypothetical protein
MSDVDATLEPWEIISRITLSIIRVRRKPYHQFDKDVAWANGRKEDGYPF